MAGAILQTNNRIAAAVYAMQKNTVIPGEGPIVPVQQFYLSFLAGTYERNITSATSNSHTTKQGRAFNE